jgi:hypothetical protein
MLKGKDLPRCASLGMPLQILEGVQLEQGMENAAVAYVGLGIIEILYP